MKLEEIGFPNFNLDIYFYILNNLLDNSSSKIKRFHDNCYQNIYKR